MLLNQHHPFNWLEKLIKTMMSSRCRQNKRSVTLEEGCWIAGRLINSTIASDSGIWWVGNGGSAAICSHLSQDLLNKLGGRSFYLGDASLMTCMANDFGYKNVYRKPLEKLVRPKDLLIAISSSGNSENILSCARLAHDKNMKLITLSGFEPDSLLWNMTSDLSFYVPADLYGIVESSHESILHGIIESLWLEKTKQPLHAGAVNEECLN